MNQSGYADLLNESIINADSLIVNVLTLPNLDPNSVPYIDVNNNLSDVILNNGQVLIGRTGNAPIANTLTGTTNEINITNASGSITLSTPQPIATTSSPTFNALTISTINGKVGNDLVTGPTSAINNDLCSFNLTSGNVVKDSGILTSNVFLKDGSVAATGTFNMNNNIISNISKITTSTAASGNVIIGENIIWTGFENVLLGRNITLASSANDCCVTGKGSSISSDACNILGRDNSCTGNTVQVGYSNTSTGDSNIVIGNLNSTSGNGAFVIGMSLTNSVAHSLLIGDTSFFNIRPASSVCDLGTSAAKFQTIFLSGSVTGPTNSRTADNIVSNTSTGASGHLASFVSDKVIQDSAIISANVVTNTSTATNNHIAIFSGAGGKLITDGGHAISEYLLLSGGTMTGSLNMGTQPIGNISGITMTGFALPGTSAVISIDSTFGAGNYISVAGAGRNIGVINGGPLFMCFNADYNSTSNLFKYNANAGCSFIHLDSTGGFLQYAPSGAPGTTATPTNALSWDVSGNVSCGPIFATSLTFSPTTNGIKGTTTANDASAGYVGEFIESDITVAGSMTSGVAKNITSISLTAGDWDVWGGIFIFPAGTCTVVNAAPSTTSAAFVAGTNHGAFLISPNVAITTTAGFPIGMRRYSFSATTTVFLVISCTFTSTCNSFGNISARRVR
jgi:hypothetical protein